MNRNIYFSLNVIQLPLFNFRPFKHIGPQGNRVPRSNNKRTVIIFFIQLFNKRKVMTGQEQLSTGNWANDVDFIFLKQKNWDSIRAWNWSGLFFPVIRSNNIIVNIEKILWNVVVSFPVELRMKPNYLNVINIRGLARELKIWGSLLGRFCRMDSHTYGSKTDLEILRISQEWKDAWNLLYNGRDSQYCHIDISLYNAQI